MSGSPEHEQTEVVVIGGGLAGLAAAWQLRDRECVVLEADERIGGRLHSLRRDPYWLNLGAGVFSGHTSPVRDLIREVGLETREIPGNMMGLAFNGRVVAAERAELYPLRLPLSLGARASLALVGTRLRLAVARYNALSKVRPGETEAAAADRLFAFEGDRSFKDFLGPLHPDVEAIFRCTAANRIGTELEEISANAGIGTFAYQFSGKASRLSHNLMGGSARLPQAVAEQLGPRIRTGAVVECVEHTAASVTVTYRRQGALRQIRAQAAIVATPADIARQLIHPLPDQLSAALASVRYGQAVLMAILTGEEGAMPYDQVYAVSAPQERFTILINVANTLRGTPPRLPGGSLLVYAGGNKARALFHEPDTRIERIFLESLQRLYPQTKTIVRETVVQRWDRIVPFGYPGRHHFQASLRQPLDRVFLAGDYLGHWANMEVAVTAGQQCAQHARAVLSQTPAA